MELAVIRQWLTSKSSMGRLSINGVFFCHTLEDPVRAVKIPKETAIGYGRYEVVITPSVRFKRDMPLLLNVPNFQGVRIHAGNGPDDTEGCILVGMERGFDKVWRSREAYDALFQRIKLALDSGDKVYCSIEHGTVLTPEGRSDGFVA